MQIFNLPSTVILFSISHTLIHSALATPVPRGTTPLTTDYDYGYDQIQAKTSTTGTPNLGGVGNVNKQQLGQTTGTMAAAGVVTTQQRPPAQKQQQVSAGPQSVKTTTTTTSTAPPKNAMSQQQQQQPPQHPAAAVSPWLDVADLRKELVVDPAIFKSMFYHPSPKQMMRENPVMFITHIRGYEPEKTFSDPAAVMTNDQVVNKFRESEFGLPANLFPKLTYYKIETSKVAPSTAGGKGKTVYNLVELYNEMMRVGAELALDPEDIVIATDMTLVNIELKSDTMGKVVGDVSRGFRKATTWK
ncbi:uncharacterized protein PgNI_09132 [Pyricularia grisea]|uniref:Uncharacterized protein n=1 Tax=Pyricularia grisea TaxID=148305 RepID=A0A6P8ASM5_PYRGI|nr:uncharacterized protein PgNI_09132 [Pyricularia grisea]TLD05126.1 hypothetical protein PgNI_09132 [Pyricularia grisea]